MDAKKIKLERLQLGLSQEKMAQRLGVIARTIRNYESGKTHVPDTVTKLHNCLKEKERIEREKELNNDLDWLVDSLTEFAEIISTLDIKQFSNQKDYAYVVMLTCQEFIKQRGS
tara:strand:- start:1785 stop:2126 length:342 start_codon:yes stop_codon:yes gene_type:complete